MRGGRGCRTANRAESVWRQEKNGTDENGVEAGSSDTIYLCPCQAN